MLVVDVWNQGNNTAIYCKPKNEDETNNVNFNSIITKNKAYKILGHDKLNSLDGSVNFMFLLDTSDSIDTNSNVECK